MFWCVILTALVLSAGWSRFIYQNQDLARVARRNRLVTSLLLLPALPIILPVLALYGTTYGTAFAAGYLNRARRRGFQAGSDFLER